jgi:hypothetical protein
MGIGNTEHEKTVAILKGAHATAGEEEEEKKIMREIEERVAEEIEEEIEGSKTKRKTKVHIPLPPHGFTLALMDSLQQHSS